MLKLRRTQHEPRVEIVPLIDVVFLVLTFFIYAMVLMVPARLLPLRLQALASGEPGRPVAAVSISIDEHGTLFVDREPVSMGDLLGRVMERIDTDPDAVVYIAADDRGPVGAFKLVLERLNSAGLEIKLVGGLPEGTGNADG